jgi:hypothetical protein
LFRYSKGKSKAVRVIHEEVVLTPEGAEVWQQAMDPKSAVGKPTSSRRRLREGDATR